MENVVKRPAFSRRSPRAWPPATGKPATGSQHCPAIRSSWSPNIILDAVIDASHDSQRFLVVPNVSVQCAVFHLCLARCSVRSILITTSLASMQPVFWARDNARTYDIVLSAVTAMPSYNVSGTTSSFSAVTLLVGSSDP